MGLFSLPHKVVIKSNNDLSVNCFYFLFLIQCDFSSTTTTTPSSALSSAALPLPVRCPRSSSCTCFALLGPICFGLPLTWLVQLLSGLHCLMFLASSFQTVALNSLQIERHAALVESELPEGHFPELMGLGKGSEKRQPTFNNPFLPKSKVAFILSHHPLNSPTNVPCKTRVLNSWYIPFHMGLKLMILHSSFCINILFCQLNANCLRVGIV